MLKQKLFLGVIAGVVALSFGVVAVVQAQTRTKTTEQFYSEAVKIAAGARIAGIKTAQATLDNLIKPATVAYTAALARAKTTYNVAVSAAQAVY